MQCIFMNKGGQLLFHDHNSPDTLSNELASNTAEWYFRFSKVQELQDVVDTFVVCEMVSS